MMAVATYRPGSTGRFPRWGYLDKFYNNEVMPKAFVLTVLACAIGVGGWQGTLAFQKYLKRQKQVAATGGPVKKRVAILTAADIGVPPSLTQTAATQVKVEVRARPAIAMPKPVADELAVESTIATTEEMASVGSQSSSAAGLGSSDSLVVDTSGGGSGLPSPDDYVAYEKEPELVSMQEPVYPELAREAGVEGTVLIRVLVGEDGFVKDEIIIQSVSMLDDNAAAAARTAVFKPALQKDKPVAVWMVIPIEFRLHQ
jgi:TonB family protein